MYGDVFGVSGAVVVHVLSFFAHPARGPSPPLTTTINLKHTYPHKQEMDDVAEARMMLFLDCPEEVWSTID